jgi:peptidoglycan hydrolase-like protein with peptidoglycan-binding domain
MLNSPRFASNQRLQKASENSPAIRWPESGDAIAILQQALIDLGFPLPSSTTKSGGPDGILGTETLKAIRAFQKKHGLTIDGVVGRQTMNKLDVLLPTGPTPPPTPLIPYRVPGIKSVLAQPSSMSCWATVYCMMRSWKEQQSFPIRDAVLKVGTKWANYYDKSYPPTNAGLPSDQFAPFLADAGMTHQPMANLMIEQWARLMRRHGLLWIGAAVTTAVNSGLHSRILEGMHGDGHHDSTWMKIIDPDGGKTYDEPFMIFLAKYEAGIMSVGGDYFQIRHFR